jgi:hypothetical protein
MRHIQRDGRDPDADDNPETRNEHGYIPFVEQVSNLLVGLLSPYRRLGREIPARRDLRGSASIPIAKGN